MWTRYRGELGGNLPTAFDNFWLPFTVLVLFVVLVFSLPAQAWSGHSVSSHYTQLPVYQVGSAKSSGRNAA